MNAIAIELKAMADRLRELFPESNHVTLSVTHYSEPSQELAIHHVGDYHAGTALMQRLGIGKRDKRILDGTTEHPWSVLEGEAEGVLFTAYCNSIPPSCRIEITTKRIPKTATVDTGEFIEVQERVVKCGQEAVA